MEETSVLSNPGNDGHVLVQFYGNLPRYCRIYFPDGSFLDLPDLSTYCTEYFFVP